MADAFQVVPVPGKGLGCVAFRAFATGERLLAERPLLVFGGTLPPLDQQVANLASGEQRAHFYGLAQEESLYGSEKSAPGIAKTNAIPFLHKGRPVDGVFALASRINHACTANARFRWNASLGMLTVHACKTIKSGEEICFNYSGILRPRDERRAQLRADFGFECSCRLCCLGGEAHAASEARIREIVAAEEEVAAAISLRALVLPDSHPSDLFVRLERRLKLMEIQVAAVASMAAGSSFEADAATLPVPVDTANAQADDAGQQVTAYPLADLILEEHSEACQTAAARLSQVLQLRSCSSQPSARSAVFQDPADGQRLTVCFEGLSEKLEAYREAALQWAAKAKQMELALWGEVLST